jgi:hypothetical protein
MINGHHPKKEIPLQDKVELLEKRVEEVQKYELLTTNQYLQQMSWCLRYCRTFHRKDVNHSETNIQCRA